ncbi:unnamed protein product [Trichogramma brassicae]|uniref:WD repeat-containing protein 7 n=1 Tax=Trichogramma brassicae TaxID=86971 RepID=A0A6H5IJ20_9HYME|nr:unnamed protein product [Trichogramma brassicae]
MPAGNGLVIPIVLWGRIAPTHCISCIYLSRDQKTLVTGCYDGQICLWAMDPETLKMTPRCLLVGHTAPVMCLSRASVIMEQNFIVSSSENGEMCTWDLVDGKCRENVKLNNVHTQMLPYVTTGGEDVKLFCSGYYPEVLVMDPFSLEVLFALSSRMNPDWISALHVLRPAKRTDDVVLAITTAGTVKVWTLLGSENRNSEPLFEHESKQIRCVNALCLTCCPYNQRTVLIVCSKYWQIYDAGDFSVLCSVDAPVGERWMAGDFLSADRVIVWSDEGHGYLYKLPANSVADNKDFHTAAIESDQPYLYCTLTQPGDKPRIQKCICSVASDHSVTLLSLAERKCVVLASRHLFPVVTIKWRPGDDFMIVGCSDGAVYVWQMETGHLDRVLHGIIAEEVLYACDENTLATSGSTGGGGGELGLANPAVHFFRGLRHRNLSAIRHATQRGLHQLQQLHGGHGNDHGNQMRARGAPLNIQGFRSNPKDPESHILFFDIEGLIGDGWNSDNAKGSLKRNGAFSEPNSTMEIAQLLLSLLHAWGMDADLDRVCESKLGLLRPMVPVSFGVISKGGYMSFLLPTYQTHLESCVTEPIPQGEQRLPMELVRQERLTRAFTKRAHWELSTTLTSNHLLAVVALSNTLMSMTNATFVPEQERNRKLHRLNSRPVNWNKVEEENEEMYTAHQAQIKQGWSLIATLHCVLLPDKVSTQGGSRSFKRPQVEMMARRWQHQCLEIREAAQALLLAELGRMGVKGRKALVDYWSPYLPQYSTQEPIAQHSQNHSPPPGAPEDDDEEELAEELSISRKPSSVSELRRKQTTAVVLLGVIGAEFGQDIGPNHPKRENDQRRKSSVVEGFGIGNNNLSRLTSMALTHLLSAIDLIGRGFTVWEPYLDVSRVLLSLLEMCCEADKLVPTLTYGLPLTPAADSCRTARHALTLIATVRPAAFITTMAREVARYNTMAQNAQTLNVNLGQSILARAKPEILRIVEQLIEKMQSEMSDLLVEVMDIILHCLDPGHLKTKPLNEVFPAICKFNQISHYPAHRRIAVGSKTGHIALYELRGTVKCQTIIAHQAPVTALAFSPEGKYLVSYSVSENKLCFWQQISSGMFGLGNSQTRCIKSYSTAPINDVSRLNPMRLAKLIWINNRQVTLMLADSSETRFNV